MTASEDGKPEEHVMAYWIEKARSREPVPGVRAAVLRRIQARLREGFTEEDLTRCVDVALLDEFYVEHHYFKQPDVFWRNAERVQSLLAKWDSLQTLAKPKPSLKAVQREATMVAMIQGGLKGK